MIEHLDVVKYIGRCHIPGLLEVFANALLQAVEEGLHDGIVPAVVATAHAGLQTMRFAKALKVITTELNHLI